MTNKKQGSSKLRQDDSMDFEQQQPYRQHYQDEYDEDDIRRQRLHEFNVMVANDDRVEQTVLTVREGITIIRKR